MNRRAAFRLALVLVATIARPVASSAQLKVITSGGFSAAYHAALPEFERSTGITVTTLTGASQGSGPNTIGAQLRRGVPADVVLMSREGLRDLLAEHIVIAGTDVDLAEAPLGASVRAGASRPDISTVAAFTEALLHAQSITFPNSTTGIWMTTVLFPRLQIADRLAPKTTSTGVAAVAKGDAELAIQPVSELLHVEGTEFVGTLPAEVQFVSVFSGAIVATSKELDAAKRLIAFLASEAATAALQNSGMARPSRR